MHRIRGHRGFQLIVTAGILTTTVIAITHPHLVMVLVLLNCTTNLIWVWEPLREEVEHDVAQDIKRIDHL